MWNQNTHMSATSCQAAWYAHNSFVAAATLAGCLSLAQSRQLCPPASPPNACRVIQSLGLVLGIAGFAIGFAIAGGWDGAFHVHRNLGMAATVLGIAQVGCQGSVGCWLEQQRRQAPCRLYAPCSVRGIAQLRCTICSAVFPHNGCGAWWHARPPYTCLCLPPPCRRCPSGACRCRRLWRAPTR